MRQDRAFQILILLLALAIILTVSINATDNASPATLDSTSISVLPAKVIWEKTYGGTADDRAFYAVPAGDGFLIVGSSKSIKQDTIAGWVLRLDKDGNVVWNQTFLEGSGIELRYALNLTDGFLLVGNVFSASGDVNGYVARIDNQGTLLWKTQMGGEKTDKLFSAIGAPDGFVLFGLTYSYGNGGSAAWVVKLDANGNVIWNKTYGGATDDAARSGVLAGDGDYLAAGYTNPQSDSNYDFLLLKIDSNGNMVWNKTFGGAESEKAYAMAKAVDGYVIVGDAQSPNSETDAWVLKADLNGNMLWNKTVGGKNADSPACITPSRDGGYLVAGYTFSFGKGQRDFWLFKIDDQGQVLCSCTQGNEAFQEAYSVIEVGQNQFVMAGWADPAGLPALIGKATYDFYVAKVSVAQNSNGLSNFQFIAYTVAVFGILLAGLLLLFKLRKNQAVTSKLRLAEA
jgi:hypothetical protein